MSRMAVGRDCIFRVNRFRGLQADSVNLANFMQTLDLMQTFLPGILDLTFSSGLEPKVKAG